MQKEQTGRMMIGLGSFVIVICAWILSKRRNRSEGNLGIDTDRQNHCLIRLKQSLKFVPMNKEEYEQTEPQTIQDLFFNQKNNSSILKQIQSTHFINLERLSVNYNHITSIEPLTQINMPYLYYLQLQNNLIHSIKSLRKVSSNRVCLLQINNNPITDGCQSLTEMKLEFNEYFWMQHFMTDFLTQESISYFLKIQANYLKRVFLGSRERIHLNGAVVGQLHKRYHTGFQIRGIQP